jgi:hypothetical protein
MYALVSCRMILGHVLDQPNFIVDLTAIYGDRRPETWRDDTLSFVLHRDASAMSLGVLVAVIDSDFSPLQAKSWCMQRMTEAGLTVTEWRPPPGDPDSWMTLQPLAFKFYYLRRHQDTWALVMGIA